MAGQADDRDTTNGALKPSANALSLDDDPRWRSIQHVQRGLAERVGSPSLATRDLNQALVDGSVRCHWRWFASGERQWQPLDFWIDHEVYIWSDGKLSLLKRQRKPGMSDAPTVRDVLYVWEPDVDKRWPTAWSDASGTANLEQKAQLAPPKPPRKRGTRPILTPDDIAKAIRLMQAEFDQHPGQRLPQKIWLAAVLAKLRRDDGEPIQVSAETLRRALIGKRDRKNLSYK